MHSVGWGTFHLGLSGSTDPEPGRCRRTDGKKWRCSREAVPDQKYCERHINRGRHRSRKPVEGHNGQVATGTISAKVVPIASLPSASVMCSSGTSESLGPTQHQFKSLLPTTANPSTNAVVNRMQGTQGQSMISPIIKLKSKDDPFSIPKQHVPIGESSQPEFSIDSSASLIYPSDKSSYSNPRNCESFLSLNDQETHHKQPLRHFMNDLPKNKSDRPTVSWPEEFKSDWTRLSMSIPMASCDFSSCLNSPRQEKFTLMPLSDMSLGASNDPIKKPTNWIPVAWGNSMGGPLGEALNSIPTSVEANKSSSVLNLMTEAWDGRPQLGSSPTGVLQKATFVSVSNSSSGSSPGADYKASGSLTDDVPCSTLASSVSIPSL